MDSPYRLWIVGIKHSGKTVVGRYLAKHLPLMIYDLDEQALETFNAANPEKMLPSVRSLYQLLGARRFLTLQLECSKTLVLTQQPFVCSTGGGVAESPELMKLFRETGVILFLDAPPEETWTRIATGGTPAFLKTDDPKSEFLALARRRAATYLEHADFVVDTYNKGMKEVKHTALSAIRDSVRQGISHGGQ